MGNSIDLYEEGLWLAAVCLILVSSFLRGFDYAVMLGLVMMFAVRYLRFFIFERINKDIPKPSSKIKIEKEEMDYWIKEIQTLKERLNNTNAYIAFKGGRVTAKSVQEGSQ